LTEVLYLINTLNFNTLENKIVIISFISEYKFVNAKKIVRVEAQRAYCIMKFKDGTEMMISKSLKEVEEMLQGLFFFRCHKSHLVNVNYVEKYFNSEKQCLVLTNADEVPLAPSKKNDLFDFIKTMKF
jgi:two-component system LytT family response regulator